MSLSIVIVDDSRAIQAILTRTIRAAGFEDPTVHAFSSGADALSFLDQHGADLVLTDWHMPGMSGLELLQAVRQLADGNIPVGLVTTETAEDLLGQATNSGAAFILRKPFKDVELQDAVKRTLAGALREVAAASSPAPVKSPPARQTFERGSLGEKLEASLLRHFGATDFSLQETPTLSLEMFSPQVLLSLFLPPNERAVSALTVLDSTVMLMLMGGATKAAPEVIRPLIAGGATDASTIDHAQRFLRASAGFLAPNAGEDPATVRIQCSMVPHNLSKLQDWFTKRDHLRGFKLQVAGYGEGYLALLTP